MCLHCPQSLSLVQLFVTPWTVAYQAPLSMEFSRQEYWSGLPFASPGDLPDPMIKPTSPGPPALASVFFTTEPPGKLCISSKHKFLQTTKPFLLPKILLEKAMAPHSSTLAWKIPWTEEPGRLQSMGLHRVGHDWATSLSLFTFMSWRRKWQPTPVFLPGESQGRGSLVGCVYGVAQSQTWLKWLSSSSRLQHGKIIILNK